MSPFRLIALLSCCLFGAAMTAGAQAQSVDELTDAQEQIIDAGQANQEQVERLDDQTSEIVSEYRALLEQLETVQIYNRQLERLIEDQERERASLQRQIDRVETIERDITPLMLSMAAGLGEFVERDVPFLIEERRDRAERIDELMSNANATNAEKFRRVVEAYQIENEYGRTIESYRGELEDGRTVEFLRIGRLLLIYQTLDGEEYGIWNTDTGSFELLGNEYALAIRNAIRIANQQVAPDLVILPVPAPETAQ